MPGTQQKSQQTMMFAGFPSFTYEAGEEGSAKGLESLILPLYDSPINK